MQRSIDFNCDLGESFGAWKMGTDAAILPFVSSANIACGFHAGDPQVMQATVQLCVQHGVAIGAHPALPDLQGFGRREMKLSAAEVHALVLYQVGALQAFAHAAGTRLRHVKPHGALYNMAARDADLAGAVAAAVREFNPSLHLVGLAHSELTAAGEAVGLRVLHEAFAERRYEADGSLTPRSHADAELADVDLALQQVAQMLHARSVTARTGETVALRADTICLHGDRPDAPAFAKALRAAIESSGFSVHAP